ncbi:ABC transporter substrate-binding protein [Gemella sp. GH3]|uniref:ABC transporter substrate-binding protein n=1 Tax=unclassified Gemella TaxID=2624949 RepID=UPI0015CFC18C|nr:MULTISPECIES: ABC transporter substrate-binding protein [unclassified Gemella]MBF0714402.1 ABC transporter substrate-binding protein [Gemella sp. GH3.1]NYS51354.1 ABC transporter substrate-binding protein [Gemella sp. GH3]
MKKLIIYSLVIFLVSVGLLHSRSYIDSSQSGNNNTLTIFNWGEYISPELIKKFEDETGISVIYETFDSNEALLTKLKSESTSYDIVVPSDYMIKKMIDADMLKKLDKSKIEGFENLDERLVNQSFDYNNVYSVPYFWGTLGIVYNSNLVDEDMTFEKWDDLWDSRLKNEILLIDGAREMLGIALQSEGKSVNETNEVDLRLAERKLELLGSNIKAINSDEKIMLMSNNEAKVAVAFSGDANEMISNNEDLVYRVPKDGSNIWFDNMVIPKVSKNEEAAYKFINFMLRPENAAINAEYIGYSTPVKTALELLPEEIVSDEQFYPKEDIMKRLEVYQTQTQKIVQLQNDLFLEFKINSNRN